MRDEKETGAPPANNIFTLSVVDGALNGGDADAGGGDAPYESGGLPDLDQGGLPVRPSFDAQIGQLPGKPPLSVLCFQ